jgi:nucleotide-binding universal stress UspA family protein
MEHLDLQIRSILIPVDFSGPSRQALRFASDLARRYEASLLLLHVYQIGALSLPRYSAADALTSYAEIEQRVREALDELRQEAEAAGAPRVGVAQVVGVPYVEIVRRAEEGGHDLIVMGTHGHTGVRRMLIGSVAEKVVRHAPCPVLVVRKR